VRLIVIVPMVIVIIGGIHSYLWWRLVAGVTRSRRWRWAGAATLLVLVVCALLGLRAEGVLPEAIAPVVAEVGMVWIALMFYLFLILLVLELVRLAARLPARRRAPATAPVTATESATAPVEHEPEPGWAVGRRVFLSRALAVTAGVAAAGTVGYGMVEARHVRLKRVPMTLAKLDPRMAGFRFAVLTDIHLSETLRRPFLADVVRRVNALDVDAVAVVGDLVDGSVDELGGAASALADLRSTHGTYFVTGNHEYYSGAQEWVEFLPSLGVRVLRNERLALSSHGATLDLAGVDDVTAKASGVPGHGANLSEALHGRDTDRPVVLLAHQPVQWPEAARRGVDLQLSGHTHGGQLWPFTLAVPLQQPVVAGRARDGDSQIYVSRGVGYWGPPVRVGAPPEISVVELRSPS
jgi:predicted MPP superfamily phosphohydrolase